MGTFEPLTLHAEKQVSSVISSPSSTPSAPPLLQKKIENGLDEQVTFTQVKLFGSI